MIAVELLVARDAATNGPTVLWLSNEHYLHYTNYHMALKAAGLNSPSSAAPQP